MWPTWAYLRSVQPFSHSSHPMIWHEAQFYTPQTIIQCWTESKKNSMIKMPLASKVDNLMRLISWLALIHKEIIPSALLPSIDMHPSESHELDHI